MKKEGKTPTQTNTQMKTKLMSREDANARCVALDIESSVLRCALSDVVNGKVKWFGHPHSYSVGVARPSSACGGIAIVRASGAVIACDYLERYAQSELRHISMVVTGENTEHNRELLARRSAIESAVAYRNEVLHAA